MGRAVKQVSQVFKSPGQAFSDPGNPARNPFGDATNTLNRWTGGSIAPMAEGGNLTKFLDNKNKAPSNPGTDPLVAQTQQAQLTNAQQFRANLPQMQSEMNNQLSQQGEGQLHQNLEKVRTNASSRGLLYGGLRQGAEQSERAKTAGLLAQGRSDINAGTNDQANQLDLQAIQTGLDVQNNQQSIQNNIYAQALAKMNNQNAMLGGFFKMGGSIGGMFAGGA